MDVLQQKHVTRLLRSKLIFHRWRKRSFPRQLRSSRWPDRTRQHPVHPLLTLGSQRCHLLPERPKRRDPQSNHSHQDRGPVRRCQRHRELQDLHSEDGHGRQLHQELVGSVGLRRRHREVLRRRTRLFWNGKKQAWVADLTLISHKSFIFLQYFSLFTFCHFFMIIVLWCRELQFVTIFCSWK